MQFELEKEIIKALKTVFDPEIPVNIYDLGLIYEVLVDDNQNVKITMTLTAPNCPMADDILNNVHKSVKEIEDVSDVVVNLTFEPTWTKDMMSEEAMLELGFL
jgi:Predicted metal-sulfur cluster biosynthetic enzyme